MLYHLTNSKNDDDDLWNDDDFGIEYAKFKDADIQDSALYDDNLEVLYIEPLYSTIKNYTNLWNKRRKMIRVNTVELCDKTPYDSDVVVKNNNLYLDMGARLFNVVKKAKENNWKYVKILKTSNPVDVFDTHYYISEYKLKNQQKVSDKKPTKKK